MQNTMQIQNDGGYYIFTQADKNDHKTIQMTN